MPISISDEKIISYLKSLTLLCVEDNEEIQLSYKSIFKDLFHSIEFVTNGEDGYQRFLESDINMIITSYEMSQFSSLNMIKKIRELDQKTPIILLSSIEDISIILEAVSLNFSNFIQKPLSQDGAVKAIFETAKSLMIKTTLKEHNDKEIKDLQTKEKYTQYQEDLAFEKELNILRNDFYYQMVDNNSIALIDFLYQPLDIISGDAYSARRIDTNRNFYLLVDGMGKGLSASLTAMTMTSFINHLVDKMLEHDSFSLDILIKESIDYIKPILLDEEALAIDYIVTDSAYSTLSYSKFAMPAILLEDTKNNIIKLKSNNPPLSKWQQGYKIDEYNISNIRKFLFYSDGLVENILKCGTKVYADFIEEDFKQSFTREDLKKSFFNKIDIPEDDLTLIFIHKLSIEDNSIEEKQFTSTLLNIDLANEWYNELFQTFTDDMKISYTAGVVFTELYMNAYEHGNLGINASQKHLLLENDTYFDVLKEKESDKVITVKVSKLIYEGISYVITQISDEGEGFDTQILSKIFRNSATFNGRGVFVSRKNSLGIYYNTKGTSVLYLNKI